MDEVNFSGWRPEKSIQVVEGHGAHLRACEGQTVYELALRR